MTQFNLFCNTTSGFPSENPDTNTNAKILPDLIDICEDDGVRYLEKNKNNRDKINGISSAKICKTKCSQTKGCHYWSWNSDKNSCKLIKKVKNTGFRKQKDNAVSGSMKCGLSDRSGGKCIDPRGLEGKCSFIWESECEDVMSAIRKSGITWQMRWFLHLATKYPCGYDYLQRDFRICCVPRKPNPPPPSDCGKSQGMRIVGGEEAVLNEYPWAAALGVYNSSSKTFSQRCGGTLISKDYVLTAAHCLPHNQFITTVRLSDLDYTTEDDGARHLDVGIERTIIHPSWDGRTVKNDIALIKLERSVTFKKGLSPACLPESFKGFPLENLKVDPTVIGWGLIENFESGSTHLLKASVPIVDNPTCDSQYREAFKVGVGSKQFCAGDDKRDSCDGDSGGPVLSAELDGGRYSVIGIVSFGKEHNCANSKYPGVYTRVDKYLPWIKAETGMK